MHLPVKSKTIDEATENDADAMASGEQETPREKFYCAICGKYYDRAFEQVHVQMHNGEEKFNCSICNKVFPNEESINMHMNAHQDTRVVRYTIQLCTFRILNNSFRITNVFFFCNFSLHLNRFEPRLK